MGTRGGWPVRMHGDELAHTMPLANPRTGVSVHVHPHAHLWPAALGREGARAPERNGGRPRQPRGGGVQWRGGAFLEGEGDGDSVHDGDNDGDDDSAGDGDGPQSKDAVIGFRVRSRVRMRISVHACIRVGGAQAAQGAERSAAPTARTRGRPTRARAAKVRQSGRGGGEEGLG